MSRKGSGSLGDDPYVRHVQVRPCGAASAGGATRVNIAGYDFELIDAARPTRRDLPHGGPEAAAGDPSIRRDGDAGPPSEGAMVRRSEAYVPLSTYGPSDDDEEAMPSGGGLDLARVHRLLRGRYIWAVLLALLLGAGGVFAGLKLGYSTYQSTGLITVVPVTYMYDTPEKRNTSFQEYIKALASKIATQRVLDAAMDSTEWQQLNRDKSDAAQAAFAKSLQVTDEGQLLIVKFTDRRAEDATVGVQAVMDAFIKLYNADQQTHGDDAIKTLESARQELIGSLAACRKTIGSIAGNLGPDGLRPFRTYQLEELHKMKSALDDLDGVAPGGISVAAAAADRQMLRLLDARLDAQTRIAQLAGAGLGVNARQRIEAVATLKSIDQQIADRRQELEGDSPTAAGNGALAGPSIESMQAKRKRLEDNIAAINASLDKLRDQIAQVDTLQLEETRIQHDLDAAEESLHQRRVEGQVTFRLDQSKADRPLAPYRDTRIAFSAGGGMGGILLGVGLMAMLGLMDRRVLDPADAMNEGRKYPVLGVLPQLPEDLADPDQVATAAHGVHEIRNRLQLGAVAGLVRQVFAVTGAAAASGKTSLTVGLGVSFSSAGCKTLMIDADLIGGGLSSRINAIVRRKIGQVLLREGLITQPQLQQALTEGRTSGRRVGEMLMQLGYVAEADLLAAVDRQARHSVGLLDVIAGDNLDDCTFATGIPDLFVLPLGAANGAHAGILSAQAMRKLVEQARQHFDVILLDTGPIPGSVEASIAASHSDAVVLVVARGDTRPEVERSLAYLRQLRVQFAGLIFNRARKRDIERYGSSRVSNSDSLNPDVNEKPMEMPGSMRFGPIPRSVVSRSSRAAAGFGAN